MPTNLTSSYVGPKSFFTGPTKNPLSSSERRKADRWLYSILVKCNTEFTELICCIGFICKGVSMFFMPEPFLYSEVIGSIITFLGFVGLYGLGHRIYNLRTLFAFTGMICSIYFSEKYFQYAWNSFQWIHYCGGFFIFAWLYSRITCRKHWLAQWRKGNS